VRELGDWAEALPRPEAIVVVSAHWEQHPLAIGATRPIPLIYDFYGFPERFYTLQYPAPGAPAVADRVRALAGRTIDEPARGLDHGAYIPLMCMYPEADVPVLQISLPSEDPKELFEIGRKLAPLRDEGVLLIGSGFLTHNLRAMGRHETPAWAREFDAWCAGVVSRHDHDPLLDYKARAPGVRESLPTHEHFVPLLVATGAAPDATITFPITGYWAPFSEDKRGGALARRSVQFT